MLNAEINSEYELSIVQLLTAVLNSNNINAGDCNSNLVK